MNDDFRQDTRGKLSVATTQYHARYTLLPVIKRFRQQRPHVSLSILSVDPYSAAQLVLEGIADFGLSAESLENSKDLLIFPCLKVRRIVIVPRGHPLVHARQLSLERIARYPLIVYDHRLSGGREVLDTFERNGIAPNIALSAMDSEVLKAYVTEGLGISIIQEHAYDPAADKRIVAVDPGTLFEPTTAYLTVKRGGFLRSYTREFINLLAPHLSMDDIESPVPFPERRIRSA
jgi:LysR family cys regulon transcriptional activator